MTSSKRFPLFRADHVGSLLRPTNLKNAYRAFAANEISEPDFHQVQDESIRDVIALQENIGLQAITDGEFRRVSYWARFVERVDGLTVKPAVYSFHDNAGNEQAFLSPHVEGVVRRNQNISGAEYDFLSQVTKQTPKITLPSPATMHFWRGSKGVEPTAYQKLDTYFADLATVYREEIADLAIRGTRYIQIDDVPLAMLGSIDVREAVTAAGENPDALIDQYIQLTNNALAGRPTDMTVSMHLCRGNFKGKWLAEGSYEYLAERLFNEVNVDTFFLEYDTPRAGDFAPLSFMPASKGAVLGLISTKTPQLESVDGLRRRLDEAAQYMSLDRMGISPQCGFASTVGGNPVTIEDEQKKLELVLKVADLVWG